MANVNFTPTGGGQTATVALNTSAGSVTLVNAQAGCEGVMLFADVDWLYSDASAGTYVPVKANQPVTIRVVSNVTRLLYAKVASGTGNLYVLSV